jgi:hypothetical protein
MMFISVGICSSDLWKRLGALVVMRLANILHEFIHTSGNFWLV